MKMRKILSVLTVSAPWPPAAAVPVIHHRTMPETVTAPIRLPMREQREQPIMLRQEMRRRATIHLRLLLKCF